ncbi:hypothetical protein FRB99_002505 [Tulasnella sp. 403]|nr:hypothetical protein FRB99_002505 [Tulasnella sp. 403]
MVSETSAVLLLATSRFLAVATLPYSAYVLSSLLVFNPYADSSIFVFGLGGVVGLVGVGKSVDQGGVVDHGVAWIVAQDTLQVVGRTGAMFAGSYLLYEYGPKLKQNAYSTGTGGAQIVVVGTLSFLMLASCGLSILATAHPTIASAKIISSALTLGVVAIQTALFGLMAVAHHSRHPSQQRRGESTHTRFPSQVYLRPKRSRYDVTEPFSPTYSSTLQSNLDVSPNVSRRPWRGAFSVAIHSLLPGVIVTQFLGLAMGSVLLAAALLLSRPSDHEILYYVLDICRAVLEIGWMIGLGQLYHALCYPKSSLEQPGILEPSPHTVLRNELVPQNDRFSPSPSRDSHILVPPILHSPVISLSEEFLPTTINDPFSSSPPISFTARGLLTSTRNDTPGRGRVASGDDHLERTAKLRKPVPQAGRRSSAFRDKLGGHASSPSGSSDGAHPSPRMVEVADGEVDGSPPIVQSCPQFKAAGDHPTVIDHRTLQGLPIEQLTSVFRSPSMACSMVRRESLRRSPPGDSGDRRDEGSEEPSPRLLTTATSPSLIPTTRPRPPCQPTPIIYQATDSILVGNSRSSNLGRKSSRDAMQVKETDLSLMHAVSQFTANVNPSHVPQSRGGKPESCEAEIGTVGLGLMLPVQDDPSPIASNGNLLSPRVRPSNSSHHPSTPRDDSAASPVSDDIPGERGEGTPGASFRAEIPPPSSLITLPVVQDDDPWRYTRTTSDEQFLSVIVMNALGVSHQRTNLVTPVDEGVSSFIPDASLRVPESGDRSGSQTPIPTTPRQSRPIDIEAEGLQGRGPVLASPLLPGTSLTVSRCDILSQGSPTGAPPYHPEPEVDNSNIGTPSSPSVDDREEGKHDHASNEVILSRSLDTPQPALLPAVGAQTFGLGTPGQACLGADPSSPVVRARPRMNRTNTLESNLIISPFPPTPEHQRLARHYFEHPMIHNGPTPSSHIRSQPIPIPNGRPNVSGDPFEALAMRFRLEDPRGRRRVTRRRASTASEDSHGTYRSEYSGSTTANVDDGRRHRRLSLDAVGGGTRSYEVGIRALLRSRREGVVVGYPPRNSRYGIQLRDDPMASCGKVLTSRFSDPSSAGRSDPVSVECGAGGSVLSG